MEMTLTLKNLTDDDLDNLNNRDRNAEFVRSIQGLAKLHACSDTTKEEFLTDIQKLNQGLRVCAAN